ncbi:MAG: L,D-transpeptidase [Chloroflexota bacterium]|jgi:hypothetical protein
MATRISRREFLKLCAAAGLAGLAFRPFSGFEEDNQKNDLIRITIRSVSVHAEPNDKSRILFQRFRDELVNLYYEVESEAGPGYNPVWYRVWGGFIHRANTQRVRVQYNDIASFIPDGGQVAEVTVPYSQVMRYSSFSGWQPYYRLYYESVHWITGIDEGPDGEAWYRILDELLNIEYHAPAYHFRMIPPEELAPITPDVPHHKKRIHISRARQTMTCYENDQVVFQTRVSTGLNYKPEGEIPWETPQGEFNIQSKMPSKHMGDGRLTGNPEDYELLGVPWTMFFEQTGVAFHGTFWHQDFGIARSRGCVNLRSDEAKWLFRWTLPISEPGDMERRGFGTRVIVE